MSKKILILTSEYAGHGHKSVTQALKEQLEITYQNKIEVCIVNGFELANFKGRLIEKSYGFFIKHSRIIWKILYEFTDIFSNSITNRYTAINIKKNFLTLIEDEPFDLIIALHSAFVGSALTLLEKNNKDIPFLVVISDIVRAGNLWTDKRCDFIICPTEDMKIKIVNRGIAEQKVLNLGFPLRKQFRIETGSIKKECSKELSKDSDRINLLILNASETPRKLKRMIKNLFMQLDCNITVIAGRDERLKINLEKSLKPIYGNRLAIKGYTTNISDFFRNYDILITRGGPNTLMEAISCQIPIIVIGELLGQEEGNADFIHEHKLGIKCFDSNCLPQVIRGLLANGREELMRIKNTQSSYQALDATEQVVELIGEILYK